MKQCLIGLAAGYTKSFNISSLFTLSKSHPGYDDNQNHSAAYVTKNYKINKKKNGAIVFFVVVVFVLLWVYLS